MIPEYLSSDCPDFPDCYAQCGQAVKQAPSGRWYITIGHPGFNSRANNGQGYASKAGAELAIERLIVGPNA